MPTAASGLMLGVAGEGLLLTPYGVVKYIYGAFAYTVLLILILKLIFNIKGVIKGVSDASAAGSAFTFPMATILLAIYLKPFHPTIATWMFYGAIVVHTVFIPVFTYYFLMPFTLDNIHPSTFIVYVGIAIISVGAPAFHALLIGQIYYYISFVAYMILLPMVLWRAWKVPAVLEHPTNTIICAPASLCLVGYMHSFPHPNMIMVGWLTFLSIIFLIYIFITLPRMFKWAFNPAFSAFTFPFVICANAAATVYGYMLKHNILVAPITSLTYTVHFEQLLSFCFVTYVLIRYTFFFAMVEDHVQPRVFQSSSVREP